MATSATSATSSSGLDVNSIVSQLMTVESRPLNMLNSVEASYQAKLSAYGSVKGALSSFQSTVAGLSDLSKFQAMSATSSDSTLVGVTAAKNAVAGAYTVNVTQLAQAQILAAAGQTSSTNAIGTGVATTLTFDFGTIAGGTLGVDGKYTGPTTFTSNGSGLKTVALGATNNSLQGIRDAINSAQIGVNATIVNDGSGTPYRLVLSSTSIGSTNSMKISVTGDAAVQSLLTQDPASAINQNFAETKTAQNALFTVNGIAISKASNSASDVIQGVTLNLQKITSAPVTLTVTQDTSTITTSVTAFIKAYNDLNSTLQNVTAYNPATKKGAVLQGDSAVRLIQSQVRSNLNASINTSGTLTNLSQIGVTFQKDGTLALDTAKLSAASTSNPGGIAALFATMGGATDSLVAYSAATSSTLPGSYAVNISALATQGSSTGAINLNAGLTIAPGTTANVTLDGASAAVALTAGSYSATQLAVMVQAAINGTAAFSTLSSTVTVAVNGATGFMNILSNRYGSASNATLVSTMGTDFMGASSSSAGSDVAGTVNGMAATGSGQFITSALGSSTGLKIQISGGSTGARGTVSYSQGYAYTLNELANSMLASGGMLDGTTSGINNNIKAIGTQRDALNIRLTAIQAAYVKQFTALDSLLSSMNSTSTYLTQALANLPKP
jgi:flagellar hook-associated protein 2